MQLRTKVQLMKQFQWGVAADVAAKAAVILLPALVWANAPDAATKTIHILQNCVLWLFLAALCWIFRYLLPQCYSLFTICSIVSQLWPLHVITARCRSVPVFRSVFALCIMPCKAWWGCCDTLDANAYHLCCGNRPQEDNPYLLLDEGADNPSTEMHTELGLVHSDSQADLEAGRGNESPVSIDRNFSIGDLDDEDDVSAKPAATPPSPRRQNKSLMPNRQSSGQVDNGDTSSQSSSPKHARPVPPPKPSGKKD